VSTITERAFDAIPGYRESSLVRVLRAQRLRDDRPTANATAEVHQRILDLAADDATIPLDVAAPVVDQERNFQLLNARRTAIDSAIQALEVDKTDALRTGADAAFAVLSIELARVVESVRTLAPRIGGTTADQAIKGGAAAVEAYTRISELVSDYDEIRTVQQQILREQDRSEQLFLLPMKLYGLLADSVDHLPHWGERRWEAHEASRVSSTTPHMAWLKAGYSIGRQFSYEERLQLKRSWWPSDGPSSKIEHLIWVSTECRPWVPTLQQLRDANALAGLATMALRHEQSSIRPEDVIRALGALCELTGTEWPDYLPAPEADQQTGPRRRKSAVRLALNL
jgi:hypothetical protein